MRARTPRASGFRPLGVAILAAIVLSAFGSPGTVGGWSVVDGTDDYAGVQGGGMIVGTSFDGGIDDLYTGMLSS